MIEKYKTINIFNQVWTVYLVNPNSSVLSETRSSLIGKCNWTTREIHISNNLDNVEFRKTAIHELTHAAISQLLLNKQDFTQEEVCMFVENYLDLINELVNKIMVLNLEEEECEEIQC